MKISIANWILLPSLLLFAHNCFGNKSENRSKIKVCVIGAGVSGIAVTRQLAKDLDKFEITVFERSYEVGGTWLYTDEPETDKYGNPVHSGTYKNLRTNSPKELTNFPDWPEYQGANTSCVPHYVVLGYLKNYTDHYHLRQFIQFNTLVENVKLQKNNKVDQWKVTVKKLKTSKIEEHIFDAVIVCIGNYFSPNIPRIPGLENSRGRVLHSHNYRKPEDFKNKTVIMLGAGFSGIDIGLEISKVASKLYLSHNKPEAIPVNLTQVKGVDRFENGKFILKNNVSIPADVLMFCTGYNYVFPFLDNSSGITVDENFVSPLYKYMFNVEHPSMSFVGIPREPAKFAVIYTQAQFIATVLKGEFTLPSKNEMLEDSKLKSGDKRHAYLSFDKFKYADELAKLGKFESIPEHYKIGLKTWITFVDDHLDNFRNYNFIFESDNKLARLVKAL